MTSRSFIPWLVAPLLISAVAMAYAAHVNVRSISVLSAMLFAIAVIGVAGAINRRYWQPAAAPHPPGTLFHAMRRNTRIAALVYAWAAVAFFAIYQLSGLEWRHGGQYGVAAALASGLLLYYVDRMGRPGNQTAPPLRLTLWHGLAVSVGLVFLIGSGKLATMKGDWAANHIFLFGGLTLLAVCFFAARTQRILEAQGVT